MRRAFAALLVTLAMPAVTTPAAPAGRAGGDLLVCALRAIALGRVGRVLRVDWVSGMLVRRGVWQSDAIRTQLRVPAGRHAIAHAGGAHVPELAAGNRIIGDLDVQSIRGVFGPCVRDG